MRLGKYARRQGVTYKTARMWFHAGCTPGAVQMPTGTIVVNDIEQSASDRELVGYTRVSSADQKNDLVRSADRLKIAGCDRTVSEVGGGLNGKRTRLLRLLKEDVDIVVKHRDRLTRFGFQYLEAAISPRRIIVLDTKKLDDDRVRDVTEVLTSMCARLYGRRSARNRAEKAIACAASE